MGKITAAEVNKLRKQTGAGIMDCKKALVENNGDFDKAIDYLRKKGKKLANKRADRDANQGVVIAKVNKNAKFGVIIMVNCETDFVAKNKDFIDFCNNVVDIALAKTSRSLEELNSLKLNGITVADSLTDLVGKIGEKIQISHYEFIEAPKVFAYNHQGNRLATILGLNKTDAENIDVIGHELTMQVAAMNPIAIDKDDVDSKIVQHELELGKEMARQQGKPENLIEKIAVGKLNKFYQENTLLNQDFIKDNKKTIRQFINEADKELKVTAFKRLMLGV